LGQKSGQGVTWGSLIVPIHEAVSESNYRIITKAVVLRFPNAPANASSTQHLEPGVAAHAGQQRGFSAAVRALAPLATALNKTHGKHKFTPQVSVTAGHALLPLLIHSGQSRAVTPFCLLSSGVVL